MKALFFILLLFGSAQAMAASSLVKLSNNTKVNVSFVKYDEFGNYQFFQIAPGTTTEISVEHDYLNIFSLENDKNVPYFFFPGDDIEIDSVKESFYYFKSKSKIRENELELSLTFFKLFQNELNVSNAASSIKRTQYQIDSVFTAQQQSAVSDNYKHLTKQFYLYEILGKNIRYNTKEKKSEAYDTYWLKKFDGNLQSYILTFRTYVLSYLPLFVKKEELLKDYNTRFQHEHKEIALYTVMHMAYYRDKEWFATNFEQYESIAGDKTFSEKMAYFKLTHDLSKSEEVTLMNEANDTISFKRLLTQLRGKVVLIDLWASWCVPCIGEMPFTAELSKVFESQPFQVLYLSLDREMHLFSNFSEKNLKGKLNYNILGNFNSSFAVLNKITEIPRYMLIDKQGNIINNKAPRPSNKELKEMIEKLL
ncbi:TlpA family protein disulfide reductase [Gynurincola endophyticus]|uniref:TlpA family protein disulfide reductase n=1 Tax=Gynurincola endophyticus TaxID=2479004 RepID=UPI000F8E96D4|nr:TlpA disulfide reductase family protein [Gynurincola endophyticus]